MTLANKTQQTHAEERLSFRCTVSRLLARRVLRLLQEQIE